MSIDLDGMAAAVDESISMVYVCNPNNPTGMTLDGRCYLAFYRVRRWARRVLRVQVRSGRGAVWISRELPSDAARVDEIVNTALAAASHSGSIPATAQARFVFAVKPSPPSMRAPC
jgi:hypothetical protein